MRALDEVVAFKRLADGYVFRAPSRWPFGRAEHYRVDAARKDEIAVALAEMRIRRASAVYVVLAATFAGFISTIAFPHHLPAVAAFWVTFALLLVVLMRLSERRLLQPLLSDLPRAAERITLRDRLIAGSAAIPYAQLWMAIVVFAGLAVVNALRLWGTIGSRDAPTLGMESVLLGVSVVLFTGIAVINGIIAFARMTRRGG